MNFKKELSGVAAKVAEIMEAELSKKQKEIAKLNHPKHKIDAGDLAKLRAGHKPVKEEAEQVDEAKENPSPFRAARSPQPTGIVVRYKHPDTGKIDGVTIDRQKDAKDFDQALKNTKSKIHSISLRYGKKIDHENANKDNPKIKDYHHLLQKEEAEQMEEGIEDRIEAARKKAKAAGKKVEEPKKPAAPAKRKVEGGAYGGSKQKDKEDMEESVLPFTAMLESYTEHGLKAFVKEQVEEEVDNETFEKEVEDQKASMEGKKKQPKVSAPSTQGVKDMDEEVEQLDEGQMRKMDLGQLMHKHAHIYSQTGSHEYGDHQEKAQDAIENEVKKRYGERAHRDMMHHSHLHMYYDGGNRNELKTHEQNTYKHIRRNYNIREDVEQIEERTLSEPETEKKEEYVKGMKKKLSGFKQRYGERAKEVLYATAIKMAKKD